VVKKDSTIRSLVVSFVAILILPMDFAIVSTVLTLVRPPTLLHISPGSHVVVLAVQMMFSG